LGHYGPDFRYAHTPWVKHHDENPEELAVHKLVCEWGYDMKDAPFNNDADAMRQEALDEDERLERKLDAEERRVVRRNERLWSQPEQECG
jgi:hypothetical protein